MVFNQVEFLIEGYLLPPGLGKFKISNDFLLEKVWSQHGGYESNTIIFQEDNSMLSTNYKAHLVSNKPSNTQYSISSLSPNSQRKISFTTSQYDTSYQFGLYRTVYESGNRIWLIESTDNGASWSPEKMVHDGSGYSGEAKNPSIYTCENGTYITYVEYINNNWVVRMVKLDHGSYIDYSPSQNTIAPESFPVIDGNVYQNTILLVWENGYNSLEYCAYYDGPGPQMIRNTIHGIFGTIYKPSLKSNNTDYHLVWNNLGIIRYIPISLRYTNQLLISFGAIESVSDSCLHFASAAPSISLDGSSHPTVAWTALETLNPGQYIALRQRINQLWSTYTFFMSGTDEDYWAPTVGGIMNYPMGGLRVAFNWGHNANPIQVRRLNYGIWDSSCTPSNMTETLHPNMTSLVPPGYSLKAVYPRIFGLQPFPTFMEITSFSDCLLPKSLRSNESSHEIVLVKDTTRFRLRFSELELKDGTNTTILEWSTGYDTLIVGKSKPLHDYLRTEDFIVPQNGHLKYRSMNYRKGYHQPNDSLELAIQLVNTSNNQVLSTLGTINTMLKND